MTRRAPDKQKFVIGVTGSFGSGKTTVARILKSYQTRIIDADKLAHSLLNPGTDTYRRIIASFGKGILKDNKRIDRRKLAGIIFDDKRLLKRLNRIVHPAVIRIIKGRIRGSRAKVIILDAPLLIEAGLRGMVDKLIVVRTSRDKQIKRIQKKTSLRKSDILKRIGYQIPLREKARLADFIIDNSGTLTETRKQVKEIRRVLWKN